MPRSPVGVFTGLHVAPPRMDEHFLTLRQAILQADPTSKVPHTFRSFAPLRLIVLKNALNLIELVRRQLPVSGFHITHQMLDLGEP